jgi:N-acetylglucosamine-6-sulfatase
VLVVLLAAFGDSFAVTSAGGPAVEAETTVRAGSKVNIVVILTDDQPVGTMDAMRTVKRRIKHKGVTFSNAVVPTSLCCPSRASFLTGRYSHDTGVWTNRGNEGLGGWRAFRASEKQTIATALDAAEYRTAWIGKYLSGFAHRSPSGYVPPGWDRFEVMAPDRGGDGSYFRYSLIGTTHKHYGRKNRDYSTDVLARRAVRAIAKTPTGTPLFLVYAPYAPHLPFLPAPRHRDTWPLEDNVVGFNDKVGDMPQWVRGLPRADADLQREVLTKQHETLLAADEGVKLILDELGPRLDDTLLLYISDNGFMLGTHRIIGKDVPYAQSTNVPAYLRWDGHVSAGTVNRRITPNIDFTKLIADAAGVEWNTDGINPILDDRTGTLLEQVEYSEHPAYCGWRTARYLYVHYATNEEELYDYRRQRTESRNLVIIDRYSDVLTELRGYAQLRCGAEVPGLSWGS